MTAAINCNLSTGKYDQNLYVYWRGQVMQTDQGIRIIRFNALRRLQASSGMKLGDARPFV